MSKIVYLCLLVGLFISCASGYDFEIVDNEGDGQKTSTTIKHENIIILSEKEASELVYTENEDEITFTNFNCDNVNIGDYIMIHPNQNFEEGLLIKIDDCKTNDVSIIIKKGKADLREIYPNFQYNGPLVFENLETRSSLTSLKHSDCIHYNGLDVDYSFEGGINFMDSHIMITNNTVDVWFKVRIYGKCKAKVSGTLNVASAKIPLFNLLNYNIKIPYNRNDSIVEYLPLPISIKIPCSLEFSCKEIPVEGTLIEKEFDRIFEIDNKLDNPETRSLHFENKNWGVDFNVGNPKSMQMGFCVGVKLSSFRVFKILQADLEYGINSSLNLYSNEYGVHPRLKWYYFTRLFGNVVGNIDFDEILWQSESDSLKLYPSYIVNNFDPLLSTFHTMINFNDMHVLNAPIEYGYVIHENEELPSYSPSSYVVRGIVNNTEEIKLNKIRDFLYDFNESNFDSGEYYIEPYVKTELGITALPFEKYNIKSNISIPDDDDDDWIVD